MGLELRAVQTDEEWAAMHDIRRRVLFAPGRHSPDIIYDENHPEDRADGNVPHLLMLEDVPIGVVRLDLRDTVAIVRLVAIEPAYQGQGHGSLMDELVTQKAWGLGVRQLRVNAARTAVGFYQKTGWQEAEWDAEELAGLAADCVQMVKDI